ncbi:MAG: addiction module protein [Chitinivibrionales bacterium]|nr:addiction module protein [Chitinivibrionales bacterium]
MTTLTEKIIDEALSLPNDMRAVVVDKLLESLNIPSQKEIDLLWTNEAEKRFKDFKNKKVKAIDGELVFNEIRKKYKR